MRADGEARDGAFRGALAGAKMLAGAQGIDDLEKIQTLRNPDWMR
ncbi:MAG: hypothetical protein P4L92_17460 [Rudaea sp.]|nr:hypothetical protein [Rudaea sp.]